MKRQRGLIAASFMILSILSLSGCASGRFEQADVSALDTESLSKLALSARPAQQQASVNRSINHIRDNPQTKDFTIAVSYPYVITGNMSQTKLERWKRRIQRTQAAVKSMYFEKDPADVVQIWLFKDLASFLQYNQSLWGVSPDTGYGYYFPEQKRMVMNIASGGGTLTHELIHPYIEANFPRSPLWFNEGLASLYEQSFYKDGKIFGYPNWRLRGLVAAIKADALPSLQTMMKTNRQAFLGPNRAIYYAQARYLMLYLQSRDLLGRYYRQFSANVASDPTGIDTLLTLSGYSSMERLEHDWLRYVQGLRF